MATLDFVEEGVKKTLTILAAPALAMSSDESVTPTTSPRRKAIEGGTPARSKTPTATMRRSKPGFTFAEGETEQEGFASFPTLNEIVNHCNSILRATMDDINGMRDASRQLQRQVDDLLEFQRLKQGRLALENSTVSVRHVLRRLVVEHENLSDVPIMIEVEESVPSTLWMDELRLRQLVANGLTNAIKHTAAGNISMRARMLVHETVVEVRNSNPVEAGAAAATRPHSRLWCSLPCKTSKGRDRTGSMVSSRRQSVDPADLPPLMSSLSDPDVIGFLEVVVSDTGSGLGDMDPEELFKPFAGFGRASTGQRKLASTGLGLAICRMLSRHMGGDVTLSSRDSPRGCDFVVLVPVHRMPPTPPATEDSTAKSQQLPSNATEEAEGGTEEKKNEIAKPLSKRGTGRAAGAKRSTRIWRWNKKENSPCGRILVLDDMPNNIKIASRILERLGCTVVSFSEGDFIAQLQEELRVTGQFGGSSGNSEGGGGGSGGGGGGGGGGGSGITPLSTPAVLAPETPKAQGEKRRQRSRASAYYAVVLIDIHLGSVDGATVLSAVKRHLASPQPLLIAMTAAVSSEDIASYKSHGFDGVLAKPFSMQSIRKMLRDLHGTGQYWPHH